MTQTQHTPGPWIVEEDEMGVLVLSDPPDLSVSVTIPGRRPNKRDRANARLIAAAPDLLAALQHLLEDAIACDMENGQYGGSVIEARAAIAKATGQ